MSTSKATVVLLLMVFSSMALARGTGETYSYANMDKSCGSTIMLDGEKSPGKFFSLTSGTYKPNIDCVLTVKAQTSNQRVIVVIEKMDIACGGDKIVVYDGKKDPGSILNKVESQQCGKNKYYLRTAASNTAIIQFTSNSDAKVGTGFNVVVAINFPVPSCSRADGLYRCKNNYCISNLFNCDMQNWCGDDTHLSTCR